MKAGVEEAAPARRGTTHWLVPIEPIKQLVLARFPENHPLREVILAERDVLTVDEFVAKMPVWLVLLNRRV